MFREYLEEKGLDERKIALCFTKFSPTLTSKIQDLRALFRGLKSKLRADGEAVDPEFIIDEHVRNAFHSLYDE